MSSASVEKKVTAFVRRIIHTKHSAGPLGRVVLYLNIAGEPSRELQEWAFDDDNGPNEALLSAEIEDRAESYAEDWPGACRFHCVAFFGKLPDERRGGESDVFQITGTRKLDDDEFMGSEPPTKWGIQAAQMRHNDSILKTALGAMTASHAQQARTIADQQRMVNELQKGWLEAIEVSQKLADRAAERAIQVEEARARMAREKDAYELFSILAPTVANQAAKHLGMPLMLPEKSHPAIEVLKRVVGTLKPGQIAALGKILAPEQMVGMSELWDLVQALEALDKDQGKGDGGAPPKVH